MKKTLLTAALSGLVAGAAFADPPTNIVSSANVVGYVQVETPAAGTFDLLALTQFSDGTTNNSVDIQSIINNLDALNSAGLGSETVGADRLYIYTGSGYTQYALFEDGATGPYWATPSEPGWTLGLEAFGVASADATLPRGTACWLATAAGGATTNAISSGDVFTDDTFDVTLSAGFSLLTYPYSSSVNLTNLVITGATAAGLGSETVGADRLYVYTGSGYTQYVLFQDGATGPYWATPSEPGWTLGLEAFGVAPANAVIDMGAGFWYSTASGKTITFHKIYTLN